MTIILKAHPAVTGTITGKGKIDGQRVFYVWLSNGTMAALTADTFTTA